MKFLVPVILGVLTALPVSANDELKQKLTNDLSSLIPGVEIDDIQATPISGLYEVLIGPNAIYMTGDGKYVIKGELLDISARRNLTEDTLAKIRVNLINNINKDEYIEYAPEQVDHAIYVFTDVDCGYCRKLHLDVPELNARGISVRYLAFPRAGVNSTTGKEMGDVWCAKDRQEALTIAKTRGKVEKAECNHPIAKQYELGRKLGVRGTPAIYLQSGKMLPGYLPPDELEKQVKL